MNGILPLLVSPIPQTVDTVLTVPVRDGFDVVVAVAAALVGLAFLGLVLVLVFALVQTRKIARAVEDARRRLGQDRGVEHLRNTARHLEEISATLRDEVARVTGSVTQLSDRLTQVSDRMEERIEEFNALMEVIQAEAEEVFVDSASTARGVRRGVGRLAEPQGRRPRADVPDGSDGGSPVP